MTEIHTARVGDKVIVMNGVDPLTYIDLTKVNKGNKRKAIVRYKAPKSKWVFSYRFRVKK